MQNLLNQGSPFIEYFQITAHPPALPGVNYDIPVTFVKPHRMIGVCDFRAPYFASSIFLHFQPTGKNNVTGQTNIIPDGTENWIPLHDLTSDGPVGVTAEGRFVVFKKPVQSFFISTDHPNGGVDSLGVKFNIFGTDAIEDGIFERV